MTVSEAKAQIAAIIAPLGAASTAADFAAAQAKLRQLAQALPNTEEFDDISSTIATLAPRLTTGAALAAVAELRSRTGQLQQANALLTKTASDAALCAQQLTFADVTYVATGLKNAVDATLQVRDAVRNNDLPTAAAKVQELADFLEHLSSLGQPA